jgi:hypothetical protein
MKAYRNGITKTEFVNEMKAHAVADRFIRVEYWNGEKGCAVGCGLKSISELKGLHFNKFNDHALYETHLGIPTWLALVEDKLFESMSLGMSKHWPVEFAKAIRAGANLDKIRIPFLVMLMKHSLKSISSEAYLKGWNPTTLAQIERCQNSVKQMIKVLPTGKADKIETARRECNDAANAAYASAASANAAYAANAAAYVNATAYANAAAATYANAAYACAANAAAYVNANAGEETYDYYAKQLLKLMKAA